MTCIFFDPKIRPTLSALDICARIFLFLGSSDRIFWDRIVRGSQGKRRLQAIHALILEW